MIFFYKTLECPLLDNDKIQICLHTPVEQMSIPIQSHTYRIIFSLPIILNTVNEELIENHPFYGGVNLLNGNSFYS